jgi:hypothetical protein
VCDGNTTVIDRAGPAFFAVDRQSVTDHCHCSDAVSQAKLHSHVGSACAGRKSVIDQEVVVPWWWFTCWLATDRAPVGRSIDRRACVHTQRAARAAAGGRTYGAADLTRDARRQRRRTGLDSDSWTDAADAEREGERLDASEHPGRQTDFFSRLFYFYFFYKFYNII